MTDPVIERAVEKASRAYESTTDVWALIDRYHDDSNDMRAMAMELREAALARQRAAIATFLRERATPLLSGTPMRRLFGQFMMADADLVERAGKTET